MHESSMKAMKEFAEGLPEGPLRIAEIGSCEPAMGYRRLFERPGWSYLGFDLGKGPNVDVVLRGPYDWGNVEEGSFDVVVSGQTLEHTRRPWRFLECIARIVKPGGLVCVIAPYAWRYHAHPIDCWRVYPEGMRTVMEDAGLQVRRVYMTVNSPDPNEGGDTVGIAARPPAT